MLDPSSCFAKKSSTTGFWLSYKYSSWQYCQKMYLFKRYFPSYVRLFVSILILHILFCCKNQKNVLLKEIKDWAFETYSLAKETSSWFPLKMTNVGSYACFFKFLSNRVGLDCSLLHVSKITVTCPKSVKKTK